jgi:hypothetical protein
MEQRDGCKKRPSNNNTSFEAQLSARTLEARKVQQATLSSSARASTKQVSAAKDVRATTVLR